MPRLNQDDLLALLPRMGEVLVQGCSAEPGAIAEAAMAAGSRIGALNFTGIQVPSVNRHTWLANPQCRFTTYFMTPELQAAGDAVQFMPLSYGDILRRLDARQFDAAVFSVAPPDENGMCSFGPTVDFLAELWPSIPVRIAQINPALPRTSGTTGIPLAAITGWVEAERALPEILEPPADPVATVIASTAARFIGDGATIQTGLGKIPSAILGALCDRRRLRIRSGLIGDAALHLLAAGAIRHGEDIVTGVAIGTRQLYAALTESGIQFAPVSFTHDPTVISEIPDFFAINSAMEVDLFGQAYAERGPRGWNSGPGGASDFARGAWLAGGVRIVALASSAKGASRIVPAGAGNGPVSLGRMDTDIVITEYGAADLRGLSHDKRASALIAVAPPGDREALARSWREGPGS